MCELGREKVVPDVDVLRNEADRKPLPQLLDFISDDDNIAQICRLIMYGSWQPRDLYAGQLIASVPASFRIPSNPDAINQRHCQLSTRHKHIRWGIERISIAALAATRELSDCASTFGGY